MKPVLMFIMESCPYCQRAKRYMEELMKETPKYRDVSLNVIDETLDPDTAERYDYYYVPSYYVENEKIHEGAASKEDVRRVFEAACND
ncbi:MAG: thioredoxin family protein [Clostridia bacterium]|nr:thioredoxin family protein [Clostridia bacterium]